MIATITNVLIEKAGIRVIVNFDEFGSKDFIFPPDIDRQKIIDSILDQKAQFQTIIDSKNSLQDLIGTIL